MFSMLAIVQIFQAARLTAICSVLVVIFLSVLSTAK